ncbi:ATP-binding cassette domain-containing protein [Bacillus thuringiensis]|uniref:ABC transporter domain-containing protein n=1 Tax=Bacillus thuringiensis TaxID=1428 RepID=A0A9X6KI98_BACTU|nr:ATP-binding cassette domain-containing protein [Bacillus thuringiensis]OTY98050.1 hypothetical protein BK756_32950 [Bacillus thuringiensis serovar aizawai]MCC3872235.1 ATP-binding cassette domain-containing protein [Bacillus thuringiensis]MCC3878484.1 ATP-binding cassette domain-containing protein [Bacillus thuringiensis]MCC3884747.1 ATP-binding cassette domain-containing protein [Bacillus thuringiensis]
MNKHESIVITGKSGSGESPLVDLLLKILDPDNGDILIDRQNVKQ